MRESNPSLKLLGSLCRGGLSVNRCTGLVQTLNTPKNCSPPEIPVYFLSPKVTQAQSVVFLCAGTNRWSKAASRMVRTIPTFEAIEFSFLATEDGMRLQTFGSGSNLWGGYEHSCIAA